MTARLAALLAVLSLAPVAWAHVGSPNVFYEGEAGPFRLRVIVRLPGVVPGLADIHVRVLSGEAARVTALPVHWQAGLKGSPPPDVAVPVRGEPGLFTATLWLMETGSYSVLVEVQGPAGSGTATVPLNSLATRRLPMPPGLGAILLALAALLFLGAVSILAAAVREGTLPPGAEPGPGRRLAARLAGTAGALLLAASLVLGNWWWDAVDSDYRCNRLFRATEVSASARAEGAARVLKLSIDDADWGMHDRAPLVPDHGKLMHLFLAREPEMDAFAHLHPVRLDPRTFEALLPPVPGGRYRLYADVTHESGLAQTLTAAVEVPEAAAAGAGGTAALAAGLPAADPDDSFHAGGPAASGGGLVAPLAGGFTMVWERQAQPVEDREAPLRFIILDPEANPARLEPYMGMLAHAAIRRDDGSVFAHLHPTGSISMASQEVFERKVRVERGGAPSKAEPHAAHHGAHGAHGEAAETAVAFPYAFPRAGRYRLWVQVKASGRVLTGVFDAGVEAAR